ncbi:hypothetical protein IT418_03920 [bacterium]|nr:hypothetical protein [bacterium]
MSNSNEGFDTGTQQGDALACIKGLFPNDGSKKSSVLNLPHAVFREPNKIFCDSAIRTVKNYVGFMNLFPPMGYLLEHQSGIQRKLNSIPEQAMLILKYLNNRSIPRSWSGLDEIVGTMMVSINGLKKGAIDILSSNNMSNIERGVRKKEFKVMMQLASRPREGQSIDELFQDGESFFRSRLGRHSFGKKLEQLSWVDTIQCFLTKQYEIRGKNESNQVLNDHIESVAKLSPGALYAYAKVLSVAYGMPNEEFAPNGWVWVEDWEKELRKQ